MASRVMISVYTRSQLINMHDKEISETTEYHATQQVNTRKHGATANHAHTAQAPAGYRAAHTCSYRQTITNIQEYSKYSPALPPTGRPLPAPIAEAARTASSNIAVE
jgi:hypothetical protein